MLFKFKDVDEPEIRIIDPQVGGVPVQVPFNPAEAKVYKYKVIINGGDDNTSKHTNKNSRKDRF